MPVIEKTKTSGMEKKTMCGKLQRFFFFPSFSVSVLVLQRKQPCDHERCSAERKSRASKVLIAVVWLVGWRGERGAWRGHTSLICLLLRLFSQINAVVCLQMKPDFLGMLLNPFTIARENATCKPCMKRERLDHFCSDI